MVERGKRAMNYLAWFFLFVYFLHTTQTSFVRRNTVTLCSFPRLLFFIPRRICVCRGLYNRKTYSRRNDKRKYTEFRDFLIYVYNPTRITGVFFSFFLYLSSALPFKTWSYFQKINTCLMKKKKKKTR